MDIEQYENVVIGSGEAGKYMAWHLAQAGQRTIVAERGAWARSSQCRLPAHEKRDSQRCKVASLVARGAEFGVPVGPVKADMAAVFRRKAKMVEGLQEVHRNRFKASGAELVFGEARFTEAKTLQVTLNTGGTRLLRGERVFLAVGSRATLPVVNGLADARPLTHVEALDLQRLPEHLVILGGGYVGLEFAQAARRFGSRVTVIEHGGQFLAREDPDVASAIFQLMKDEGVDVWLSTDVTEVRGRSGDRLQLNMKSAGTPRTLEATDLLVAAGRTANAEAPDVGARRRRTEPAGLHSRQRQARNDRAGRVGDG